jgi:hypothetical protein
MSDLRIQYLAVKAKAARLLQRFRENNPDERIEKSDSFLAEDWQLCTMQMARLSTELYKEYARTHPYRFINCKPQLRPGRWKLNPSVRSRGTGRDHDFDFDRASTQARSIGHAGR